MLEDGCWSLDALQLPAACRSLTGIDISDVAVERANSRARKLGASDARFLAMNAEAMSFPNDSFDLVYGRGIIHHLDLNRCFTEMFRVLRPGGVASFFEPMGHNPVLNAYRARTPDIRTEDEHPLLVFDFALAKSYFTDVEVRYFGLFSVASALMPTAMREIVYTIGRGADSLVLSLPHINRFAWHALITLSKQTH